MPQFRQPSRLLKIASDLILERIVNHCDRLSHARSLTELRHAIIVIKIEICNQLPRFLLADFCATFIKEFQYKDRPFCHYSAALGIVMDTEIDGLRCVGPMTEYMLPEYARRLRRLEALELRGVNYNLDNYHLDRLTTFICELYCTDQYLKIIGRDCPNLKVLKIQDSCRVTDEGIKALNRCSELCVVDVSNCPISDNAQNLLLSTHKKIEVFRCVKLPLTHWDASVYPVISRLFVKLNHHLTIEEHQAIITKFPNLTYIEINGYVPDDTSFLQQLDKLTGLAIRYDRYQSFNGFEQWIDVANLLPFLGANITSLEVTTGGISFSWDDTELNFIRDNCPNIEHLKYEQANVPVVVPSFPKLKKLFLVNAIDRRFCNPFSRANIEFEILPELETLSLPSFYVSLPMVESIILDHIKFPKLSVIETRHMKPTDIKEIERIARIHNLDFRINAL